MVYGFQGLWTFGNSYIPDLPLASAPTRDGFDRTTDHRWYLTSDVVRLGHDYDRAGNRLTRVDSVAAAASQDFDELYRYDGINRLTSLERGDYDSSDDEIDSGTFAEGWGLDALGNWEPYRYDSNADGTVDVTQNRVHNRANEITSIDSSTTHVAHDAAGNMTKLPQPGDWNDDYELTFDAWNRLVKVEDGETTVAEYAYAGNHFRITKATTTDGCVPVTETRHYYYDHRWRCLEERVTAPDGCSTPEPEDVDAEVQYVWGERYVDELLFRDRDTTEPRDGDFEERLWALQDANWNVVALADDNGAVQERYAYDGYGRTNVLNADFTAKGGGTGYAWEFLFTGRRRDGETQLMYYRYRYYHCGLGRFVSRDPVEADQNLYRYVRNNPVLFVDPMGLWWPELGIPGFETTMGDAEIHIDPDCVGKGSCGTGVPGIPLDQLFFRPADLTSNLGAWMQVDVHATDLCDPVKPGEIRIDLIFRWVQYAARQHKNKKYKVTVDGQPITISEGNTTKKVTPVEPPVEWPWPEPLGKIKVKQWYAWTGSYTKKLASCPKNGDGSVEIRVAVDYKRPGGQDMVETAKVDWSYGCAKQGGTCCTVKRPFTCKVAETSYASWGMQHF